MPVPPDCGDHRSPPVHPAEGALDALDDGCAVVSPDWRIVFANAAFAGLAGRPPSELMGAELWSALPALAGAPAAMLLRASMTDRRRRSCRVQIDGTPGEIHEMKIAPLGSGGLCVQVRDVSEEVRFEQELAERIEENISLREVARVLAAEVDLPTLLQVICREAMSQCDASSATIGEIEGDEVHLVAATGVAEPRNGVRFPLAGSLTERAAQRREPVLSTDYTADYPRHAALLSIGNPTRIMLAAPLVAHDGVLGVLVLGRESGMPPFGEREVRRARAIADHAALAVWKARLLDELQEANRAKSDFLATMSHELRTPLTALTGYEELLADGVLGPLSEAQRNAVERMRSSIELLTTIIDEILTFSRLEAGQMVARMEDVAVHDVVQRAVEVIEPLAREKHLTVAVHLPEPGLLLRTDADMVRRILVNLGGNAVKFTEQGLVELAVIAGDDEVCFRVRDTGIGIAAEDLPRLFQPFVQLEGGLRRRYGGSGLGLFICRQLATSLGGHIEVESEPGRGSTFTLYLPRPAPSAPRCD